MAEVRALQYIFAVTSKKYMAEVLYGASRVHLPPSDSFRPLFVLSFWFCCCYPLFIDALLFCWGSVFGHCSTKCPF